MMFPPQSIREWQPPKHQTGASAFWTWREDGLLIDIWKRESANIYCWSIDKADSWLEVASGTGERLSNVLEAVRDALDA